MAQRKEIGLEKLHFDVQGWKSNLHHTEVELWFMDKLLHSNAFRPDTHNLFERLEEYKTKVKAISDNKTQLQDSIAIYENKLGGIMGQTLADNDANHLEKHHALREKIMEYRSRFKELKSELFNYTGSILK